MPAVQTFAVYATIAVAFDFIFQITAFLALLSLDQKRYEVSNVWGKIYVHFSVLEF